MQRKVYNALDTFDYLLPQRRNRVWGMGAVMGTQDIESMQQAYLSCLQDLATSAKIPLCEIFQSLPEEPVKEGREKTLLQRAIDTYGEDAFVDTSSSLNWLVAMGGGIPCVLPTHPVYSAKMKRYLQVRDFLMAQGYFPSVFKDCVFEAFLSQPKLGQDLARNGFSATVVQAVVLSSMAAVPALWQPCTGQHKVMPSSSSEQTCGLQNQLPSDHQGGKAGTILRHVKGKRKAEEYDFALPKSQALLAKPQKRKRRCYYRRKKKNVDSRKFSKGKRPMVSIYEKMKMLPATVQPFIAFSGCFFFTPRSCVRMKKVI